MRGQTRTLMIGAALLVTALGTTGRALAAPSGDAAGTLRVGLNLVPEPFGQFTASVQTPIGTVSGSQDTAFAFGFAPYLDYLLHPNLFVGFSPVYSVHVKGDNSNGDSSQQLDLLIRAGAQLPLAAGLQVFGYLAPGYSVIMIPNADNPSGFVLGLHAGATYNVNDKVYALFQLGYQFGYQSTSNADVKDDLFQFGLGIGSRI